MRESWTDERMDDLNTKIDRGFERVDADLRLQRVETRTEFAELGGEMRSEFAAVRGEMRTEFAAVRGEMRTEFAAVRGDMKGGFERMDERFDERFDALHRLLLRGAGAVVIALIGLVATQL